MKRVASRALVNASRRVSQQVRTLHTNTVVLQRKLVLGIETTCDETAAAVVSSEKEVLGESVASQWDLLAEHGGVYPIMAARAHADNIEGVVAQALSRANIDDVSQLDGIAVSAGPGLAPCLKIGVEYARNLAREHAVPLVAVNHLEAHIQVASLFQEMEDGFLVLLVSGGHTQLVWARGIGDYLILGSTLDDALGEAFDKVARMLHIDSVGGNSQPQAPGAALESLAREGDSSAYDFPVPLRNRGGKSCDFSYSGLKTAVRRQIVEVGLKESGGSESETASMSRASTDYILSDKARADIAACFQMTATEHLVRQTGKAVKKLKDQVTGGAPFQLVICGGVAANQYIRSSFDSLCEQHGLELVCPPISYCGDNGVMVAFNGLQRLELGLTDPLDISFTPRWPLGPSFDDVIATSPSSSPSPSSSGPSSS